MTSVMTTMEKPKKWRAKDTSSSLQKVGNNLLVNPTDWTDTDGNGLADSWIGIGDNATWSIVTGNGFTGNAQRAAAGATENTFMYQTIPAASIDPYSTYKITFMQRNSHGIGIYPIQHDTDGLNNSGFENITTVNTGNAKEHTVYFNSLKADGDLTIRFYVDSSAGDAASGEYIEVDTVEVYKLESLGNNNHGKMHTGKALEFDGISDYITIEDIASLNNFTATDTYTIACWLKSSSDASSFVKFYMGKNNATVNHFFQEVSAGRFYLGYRTGGSPSGNGMVDGASAASSDSYFDFASTTLEADTWYRVVYVATGVNSTLHCYVNGELYGTLDKDSKNRTNDFYFYAADGVLGYTGSELEISNIGGGYNSPRNYQFDGKMSDWQLWHSAWSADDVAFDYANPEKLALDSDSTSLTESNLKLWYPMNDGHRGQQSYVLDASSLGLGDELVNNGDLSGGTTGFIIEDGAGDVTISPSTEQVYGNNTQSLKVVASASADGVKCSITGKYLAGVTYKASVWIYAANDKNVNVNPDDSYFVDSGNIITLTTHGEWKEVVCYMTCDNTSGSNPTDALFIQSSSSGGTTFYIGNVSIKPVNDKHHATTAFWGDNLLLSGSKDDVDFEDDGNTVTLTQAYSGGSGSGATYDPDNTSSPLSGSKDAKFTVGSAGEGCGVTSPGIALVQGRTYKVSFNYKVNQNTMKFKIAAAGGTDIGGANITGDGYGQADLSQTSETQHDQTFVMGSATGTYYLVWFFLDTTSTNVFQIDDIHIKEQGLATGWSDADEEQEIPQTALQSYNQLAWFDEHDDKVIIADTTDNHDDIFDGGGSISAWIYPIDLGENSYGRIVDKSSDTSGGDGYHLALKDESSSTSNIQFARGHDSTYGKWTFDTRHINYGQWSHILVTYDDNSVSNDPKVYLNGEPLPITETSTPVGNQETDASQALTIGNRSGATDRTFAGIITEVSLWSEILTQAEVNDLYNDGKALDALTHSAVYGSNLVTNGDFSSQDTGWTISHYNDRTSHSYEYGAIKFVGITEASDDSAFYMEPASTFTIEQGATYKITYDIKSNQAHQAGTSGHKSFVTLGGTVTAFSNVTTTNGVWETRTFKASAGTSNSNGSIRIGADVPNIEPDDYYCFDNIKIEKFQLKGYWRNNGLSTWTDLEGNNDGTITCSETILQQSGTDGERDCQGFLMNRKRDTSSLNLDGMTNGVTYGAPGVLLSHPVDSTTGQFDADGDGTGDYTIEFWLKFEEAPHDCTLFSNVYKDGSNNYSGNDIYIDGAGRLDWVIYYDNASNSLTLASNITGLNDGEWHHVVCVVDKSDSSYLIVDNIVKVITDVSTHVDVDLWKFPIKIGTDRVGGQSGSGRYGLIGQIDDVKIYNRLLTFYESDGSIPEVTETITSGEVLRNYKAGKRSHK